MKQIIVNVDGLTIEEKKRVNEALAKIKNIGMCNPMHWDKADVLYGPSVDGVNVGFNYRNCANPTHTPQQVLEMAGMSTKRKVRKDFDPTKAYSVDVSECTQDEKKKVQQAFFDVGFPWGFGGEVYRHLEAVKYTNATAIGQVNTYCMYGTNTEDCNITAEEFLDLVYDPKKKGHVHAELMAQYAEVAKTTDKPWELWQVKCAAGIWHRCQNHPKWEIATEYRRKPKTKLIHGVEIPDFEFTPKVGEEYYAANVGLPNLFETGYRSSECDAFTQRMIERKLIYPYSEEGKQATILHSKAMLSIAYSL